MTITTCTALFLSTLSLRRATGTRTASRYIIRRFGQFLSTLSLRRATVHFDNFNLHCVISIHALLAESDIILTALLIPLTKFLSTLSLRRATLSSRQVTVRTWQFLSTLSLRRATAIQHPQINKQNDFYPRSPCGERLVHALKFANLVLFLSTLSLRRATN